VCVAVDESHKLIPQPDVVAFCLGVLIIARLRRRLGERDNCVAVLAGVKREIRTTELAPRPTLVEGMLQDVESSADSV
jgi:hypothetical protein